MTRLIAILVVLNIASHLYMIYRDGEKVTKLDCVWFVIESLFIAGTMLFFRFILDYCFNV